MNKNDLENLVEDYGYIDKLPDAALAGRTSTMVEHMVLKPKPGKKEALKAAAARVGVLLSEDTALFPGQDTKTEVLTFPTSMQSQFKDIVRQVVKGRNK